MKKTIIAAMGALAMFSCTKNEVVYSENTEIALVPVAKTATKGAAVTTNDELASDIRVFAYRTADAAGTSWSDATSPESWFNTAGTKYTKATPWHGNPRQYWPKTGSLFFAGVHPYTTEGVSFDATKSSIKVENFTPGTYNTNPETSGMVDLMWFDIDEETSRTSENGNVPALFKHALSYITINISCETSNMYEITGLTLKTLETKGNFDSKATGLWTLSGTTDDYDLTTGLTDGTVTEAAAPLKFDHILLLPQDITSKKLYIGFKQKSGEDIEGSPLQEDNLDLNFTAAGGKWEKGKHYIYNITFTPGEEILISPTVEDWVDVENNDIPELPR